MARVITLRGLGDVDMAFDTPEALQCLNDGGEPVWDNDGTMTCKKPFDWKKGLKYAAIAGLGAASGYFVAGKRYGAAPAAAAGGAATLVAVLALQPGGWLRSA